MRKSKWPPKKNNLGIGNPSVDQSVKWTSREAAETELVIVCVVWASLLPVWNIDKQSVYALSVHGGHWN